MCVPSCLNIASGNTQDGWSLGNGARVRVLTCCDAIEQRENSERSAQVGRDGRVNPVRLLQNKTVKTKLVTETV